MADYKALYYRLFNQVSNLIEAFQECQQQAEEEYLCAGDEDETTDTSQK